MVGSILTGVGALGMVLSIAFWDPGGFGGRTRTTIVERDRKVV